MIKGVDRYLTGRGGGKTAASVLQRVCAVGGTPRNEIPEETGVTSPGGENAFQGLI